ncbi:GlcNAc-PI de-N-acetylase [Pontibacter ummariensis]|uniref:GlcNAc-PI de-N-acetylase n=1 Tax=Pontibacter ummariensis TaxID=1610492 RepID=A0A239BGA8_9BACT|nr:PIG-L family deacetylase [Pontibacter ummariensis]PRY16521.1 GlcNAc-PI de-N-acetylase [Pontibacter ummariensis]SNS06662.1 GlcNAc-PI de-N-acetylase [Pontibacter ummariensis]
MLKYLRSSSGILCLLALLFTCGVTQAQAPVRSSSGQVLQGLKKLNVLGSALYVAAHPDDENTRLIAYLSNEKLYNTGYLAVTRGDGGQNLIGPEIREELGLIRTQELLQARRTDGGRQFFTRANDFGYSKDPEETFTIWDKEQVLADMVYVIRKFRPDVMITRFPPDERAGHGHHTASAILAEEAFTAAADPKRFPEQLKYVDVWQPKRLLWNTGVWSFKSQEEFEKHGKELLKVDVGGYNPLLGKSYGEIAAESRSMHKSQGFGATGARGTSIEYLQHTKGDKAEASLFEGIPTSWSRVKGGEKVGKLIQKAIDTYRPAEPAAVVPTLITAKKELDKLPDSYWKRVKQEELQDVMQAAMGLYLEVTANDFAATPGQPVKLNVEAINRSAVPVTLRKVRYSFSSADTTLNKPLQNNEPIKYSATRVLPNGSESSQPYWLRRKGTLGMFAVESQQEVGMPENAPAVQATFDLTVAGEPLQVKVPVVYKRTDPVEGEVYRPFVITPPVFVNVAEHVYVFASQEPKQVQVLVKAGKANLNGTLKLQLPQGWRSVPAAVPFTLPTKGAELPVTFTVYPPQEQQEAELKAVAVVEGKEYQHGLKVISYSHIPAQVTFPDATAKIVKLDLQKKGQKIGYLMGAGDDIPTSLQQIGYDVTLLQDEDMRLNKLQQFDAIILGVRAYNTVDRLKFYQPTLLEYVKQGGNLIVQYNTNHSLVLPNVGPYPLQLSRDRVTVEDAEVRFLEPNHPVLNTPNKITRKDFEGWVQERGLYFPNEWSEEYQAILSSNDPGEPARKGGLLVAPYGKGNYIYTGYSWFRELPAGVPGAYRLFANLISLGKNTPGGGTDAQSHSNK